MKSLKIHSAFCSLKEDFVKSFQKVHASLRAVGNQQQRVTQGKNVQMGFCRKSLSHHFFSLVQSDKAFLKEDLGVMFFIQLFFLQIKSKHGNIQSFWCRQPVCYHNKSEKCGEDVFHIREGVSAPP